VESVRVLIVDDEPPARRELRRLLAAHPNVEVVQEAGSSAQAEVMLRGDPPDVVFLDIQLREDSGLDIVPAVPEKTAIVFVTAFDQYAVRAFELNALDYLLKPVEPERLALALQRVGARDGSHRAQVSAQPARPLDSRDWLFVRSGDRAEFVGVAGITHITAHGDYSLVRTRDGAERLLHVSLNEWERRLPANDFLRIHRSAIVNLQFVVKVEPWTNHGFRVHVKGALEPLTMSRRYAGRMRERMG
jgi:two-component system LytT family response regulator